MPNPVPKLVIAFLATLLWAMAAPTFAGAQEPTLQTSDVEGGGDLETLRARWLSKSEEDRELLRRRFEALQRLAPQERTQLLERARRWKRIEQAVREDTPENQRLEIDALEPERAAARWRELAHERGRELGRRRLERLPEPLRRRLEAADPEERARFLDRLRRDEDPRSRMAIRRLGQRAGLSPERIRELEALPLERRRDAVRQLFGELVERGELPDAGWERPFRGMRPGHGDRPRDGRPGLRWSPADRAPAPVGPRRGPDPRGPREGHDPQDPRRERRPGR